MLSRFLGPRYRELAKNWWKLMVVIDSWGDPGPALKAIPGVRIPTAGMWGTVGTVGLVWATDWRLILDWVPYINGKFKTDN